MIQVNSKDLKKPMFLLWQFLFKGKSLPLNGNIRYVNWSMAYPPDPGAFPQWLLDRCWSCNISKTLPFRLRESELKFSKGRGEWPPGTTVFPKDKTLLLRDQICKTKPRPHAASDNRSSASRALLQPGGQWVNPSLPPLLPCPPCIRRHPLLKVNSVPLIEGKT